ncbi:hypothetical protein ZHAS_00006849 [Anopheles sinensis]|uniref:Uncharacterized protein n=1 Tax=Anopheles sinensis TaxID=74873 RepID=A0A084VNG4_ANOSI|nr:hypothetical protein ZHAS_00006849 [Anopheles sinensis]
MVVNIPRKSDLHLYGRAVWRKSWLLRCVAKDHHAQHNGMKAAGVHQKSRQAKNQPEIEALRGRRPGGPGGPN